MEKAKKCRIVIFVVLLLCLMCNAEDEEEVESAWAGGDHGGYICKFKIQVDVEVPSWEMALIYPEPIHEFEAWQAVYQRRSGDDRIVYLKNTLWNAHLWPGSVVEQRILVQYFKQPGVNYAYSSGPRPDIIFLDKVYFPDPKTDLASEMAVRNLTEYKFIDSYDPIEFITVPKSTTPVFTTSTMTPPPGQEDNPWWFVLTTTQSTLAPSPTATWNPGMAQISTVSTTTEKPKVVAISCPEEIVTRAKECKRKKKTLHKCYIPQCTAGSSRFKAMQCWKFRGVCWCVNPRTGSKLPDTMVRYKNAHKLNCVTGEIQETSTTAVSTVAASSTRPTLPYTPPDGENKPVFAPRTGYDYSKIIKNSLLFYEAQRSGKLTGSRVSWRKSAHLTDGNDCHKDLVGGYYETGGYVKFGFPAASAMTLLGWSYLEAKVAYDTSGQTKYLKEALTWGANYFMKAHVSAYELYGQVGDPEKENEQWGRPEDSTLKRPCYSINSKSPGSDLAAETAAALATTALVYMSTGATNEHAYVKSLLKHAKELFTFADRYRGIYSNSIRSAATYFPSQDYGDELTWAAMWLYKATGNQQYLFQAMKKYSEFKLDEELATEFSWDRKVVGAQVLLAQSTGLEKYRKPAEAYCDSLQRDGGAYYTPQGLLYMSEWGPLRYACNAAFICSTLSTVKGISQEKQFKYRKFAEEQMDYILGKSGRSYVIGYGRNFPNRPHHRASSCSRAGTCNWDTFHSDKPNAQILIGALVGGPDDDDIWTNDRTDYKTNGVGLDYNAALQSAAAMLGKFQLDYKAWYDHSANARKS